jgi:hypothetical protein
VTCANTVLVSRQGTRWTPAAQDRALMSVSQNGWTINPPLAVLTVRGVTFGGAHTGDAHVVLEYVATRFDAEVERLIAGTCGCYNPRLIPGSNVWSNHASATAIDCNWQRHPLGARGTFTAAQVRAIRSILAFCDGVIRWGGDFGNVDEMHFEINRNAAAVGALAVKIRNQEDDMPSAEEVADLTVSKLLSKTLGSSGPNVAQDLERAERIEQVVSAMADTLAEVKAAVDQLVAGA